jgi:glutaredoxin-like protein
LGLIAQADQDALRKQFAEMTRAVRLVFFTQTIGCETCLQARQILDELPALTDKIRIEEVNFVLEKEKAALYGIDRVPAIALAYEDGAPDAGASGAITDSRIRFLGAPAGFEFISLVQAVLLAGGRPSTLSADNRTRLAAVAAPLTIRVFTTPTCPHCPRAVSVAHEMAFASPHITAYAVEATSFPDLARLYMVNGVPKTVVSGSAAETGVVEILGALPSDDFIAQALGDETAGA